MHLKNLFVPRVVVLACTAWGLAVPALAQDSGQGPSATRWRAWVNHRLEMPDAKAFPRFGWSYFGYVKDQDSARDLGTYADAGFSDVQVRMQDDLLKKAGGTGLGLILGTWEGALDHPDRIDTLLKRAKSERVGAMVIVKDEPDQKSLEGIGQLNAKLLADGDARVLPLLTVLPAHASGPSTSSTRFNPGLACDRTGSYCDFVRRVATVAKPSAILPTLYAIYEDGTERGDYYEQLQEVRDLTRSQGIGHFGSVLVTPHYDGWSKKMYRRATRADIFWQAYSHIAYNAKGLSIYSYRTKPTDFEKPPTAYGEGVVTSAEGKPTETYRNLQDLNCELGALGKTLLQLDAAKVHGVRMPSQRGLDAGLPPSIEEAKGSAFLLAEMKGQGDDGRFVLVVNARHSGGDSADELRLRMSPSQQVKQLSVGPKCLREDVPLAEKDGWLQLKLEPGRAALLQVGQGKR